MRMLMNFRTHTPGRKRWWRTRCRQSDRWTRRTEVTLDVHASWSRRIREKGGETQEVNTRESTKEGGTQGEKGRAEEAGLGRKDKNSNRKRRGDEGGGNRVIRGQREHREQEGVQKCSPRMWRRGRRRRGGEIVEKRYKRQEGGGYAEQQCPGSKQWRQARWLQGTQHPAKYGQQHPALAYFLPTKAWMIQEEAYIDSRRPRRLLSLWCVVLGWVMQDLGLMHNQSPAARSCTCTPPTFTRTDLPNSPFSHNELIDMTTPTGVEGCFRNRWRLSGLWICTYFLLCLGIKHGCASPIAPARSASCLREAEGTLINLGRPPPGFTPDYGVMDRRHPPC